MKIELSLTAGQIQYISARFVQFCEENKPKYFRLSRNEKVAFSIAQDIADKFESKARNLSRSVSRPVIQKKNKALTPKLYRITIKYQEAHAVNWRAFIDKDILDDDYIRSVAQNVYSTLDPLL